MIVNREIEALAADRSIQRRAQQRLFDALEGWRTDARVAPVLLELKRFGAGAPLDRCGALAGAMLQAHSAEPFVARFIAASLAAMREAPFGQVPLRHNCSQTSATLQLAASGRARLFLVSREETAEKPTSASFVDLERHDLVLAGHAAGSLVTRGPEGIGQEPWDMAPGSALSFDGFTRALVLHETRGRLVSLRLERDAAAPRPSCVVSLADGAVLHRAQGCKRASRLEMMLALLGRMGCREAVPAMVQVALGDGPRDMRWQALREVLALDTATGLDTLDTLAARARDPLADHTARLRMQLVECHPMLSQRKEVPCPA